MASIAKEFPYVYVSNPNEAKWVKNTVIGGGVGGSSVTGEELVDPETGNTGNDAESFEPVPSIAHLVDDNTASTGKAVEYYTKGDEEGTSTTTPDDVIAKVEFSNVEFGTYSVVIRSKVNTISDISLFTINVRSGEKTLKSVPIKGTYYTTANAWKSLAFGIDFNGTTGDLLSVELNPITTSSNIKVSFDYIRVLSAPTALNSIG